MIPGSAIAARHSSWATKTAPVPTLYRRAGELAVAPGERIAQNGEKLERLVRVDPSEFLKPGERIVMVDDKPLITSNPNLEEQLAAVDRQFDPNDRRGSFLRGIGFMAFTGAVLIGITAGLATGGLIIAVGAVSLFAASMYRGVRRRGLWESHHAEVLKETKQLPEGVTV